ncbi:sensor histidine kinase [Amycolatopsis taiwanensis]|uniref:Histidine kinase/HSP90-like ATPase domain-containing protein n=1 Tax=Amycolatopsis taiwanensis TaxID=342230 RepID=A0A9W6R7D5_9PSEU|nr:ATP-binding protein [Amycolatopsis taiwanensis]GLY69645.1 hypothetical protein Atai01_62640 [Amycolatopsis taiwanensis]
MAGQLPHHSAKPADDQPNCGSDQTDPSEGHAGRVCEHQVHLSRLLRDLHDDVGSALAGVSAHLELAGRVMRSDIDRASDMIDELRVITSDLVTTVRRMSARHRLRHCVGASHRWARPVGMTCFADALRNMIGRMQAIFRGRLEITLNLGDGLDEVPEEVSLPAFSIVKEALTNVLRHSRAEHCLVSVWVDEENLHIQVQDDGIGVTTATSTRRAGVGGSGLANMTERAAEMGGWCTIGQAIPSGTVALAALPLAGAQRRRPARPA